MVNSSANIKPCHSKYTYYVHHSAYLQPSSVPSNTTYSLQPNHTVIQINTYILWSSWLLGWIYLFFTSKTSAIFFQHDFFFFILYKTRKGFQKNKWCFKAMNIFTQPLPILWKLRNLMNKNVSVNLWAFRNINK